MFYFDPSNNQFKNVYGATSTPKTLPVLTPKEQEYLDQLKVLPLDSILDRGAGEKKCRDLGQEIFDHFKQKADGDSYAGKDAMVNIANSLPSQCQDGRDRKGFVSYAWDRVGDSEWYWLH